jgi:hypothetical protein
MLDARSMQDWVRIHRQVIQLELAFAEVAVRAARGEVSLVELDEQRAILVATRELCSAAYERAFGRRSPS